VVVAKILFTRARRPVRAVALVLLATGFLGLAGGAGLMAVSKARTGTSYPLDLSLLIRYKSYVSASQMVLNRPLLGYGTGVYKLAYPQFWTPYEQKWFAQELKMNAHVHNDLLEVATEAGLPAAGLYLALLVLAISYGLLIACTAKEVLRRRLGFTFAAVFCAFMVDGLFGFNLRVPVSATLLFIMLGCLEGFWGARTELRPQPVRWWWGRAWRVAIVVLVILSALLDSRVFISRTLYQRGIGQLYGKQYRNAETLLGWGETLYPWSSDFARQRGLAALGNREWSAAIAHFDRSLALNPWYVMTLVPLAQGHLSEGLARLAGPQPDTAAALEQFEQGKASAERALSLAPTFAPAEELMGRLAAAKAMALSKGEETPNASALEAWRKAKAHFGAAIEYGAKRPGEIYRQLAQVHIALGEKDQAETALIRATQADPADEQTWPSFYAFAKDAKRYDGFRKTLLWRITRLAEKTPPDTQNLSTAYLWLAGIEEESGGSLDAAESAYRNAIHHTPRRPDVWGAYGRFADRAGRMDSFKQYLVETNSQTLQAGKEPLPQINALAKVYKGEPNALIEASAVLVAVVQGDVPVPGLQPKDLDLDWVIQFMVRDTVGSGLSDEDKGVTLFHLGLVASATQNDTLANAIFPGAMPLLTLDQQKVCAQHWADTLIRLGSPTEAVGLLRDILAKAPGSPDVTLALARACYRAANTEEAAKIYGEYLAMPSIGEDDRARARRELEALQKAPAS
jgi:tetratricopeptide (TPR) repeat protein